MGWSWKVARVAGIEVRIHATFFLILLFYGWVFYSAGGLMAVATGLLFVLALFFCVLLHEFGHAFTARAFGIRTPDITLLPIGGVARLERMPRSPMQELAIAVGGPAVNVAIAIALLPFVLGTFGADDFTNLDRAQGGFLPKLFAVNLLLVGFNMIPAFPMDGGRVLRALLAMAMRHSTATLIAARVGQAIAVVFAIAGLNGNPFLFFIALFVFMGAQQELQASRFMESVGSRTVADAMITAFDTIPARIRPDELATFLSTRGQRIFPLVDDSMRVLGLAAREDLLRAVSLPGASLAGCVRAVPVLPPGLPATQALAAMQSANEPILPVANPSGQVIGLVTAASLAAGPKK